jgi:LacI family transcriptional regulator
MIILPWQMKKKTAHATLTDVAREAGVGTTTVSRVINGGERVSPETLERVQRIIRELRYQPNHAARILKGERTKTVGLLVPSIADSFFSSCAEVAQEISRSYDSLLIVASSNNNPQIELDSVNTLIQHRVDGLLIAPSSSTSEALMRTLTQTAIPIVAFDRPIDDPSIPSVVSNNYKGAKTAVRHLIQHGYKRILCSSYEGEGDLYTIQERIRGYRHAMQEANLPCMVDTSIRDYATAEAAVARFMRGADAPDAIFCLKNIVTIYTYEALQALRIRIPASVALLGFDDFELASTLQPAITVVRQPIEQIGKIAADLLFDRVLPNGKSRGTGNTLAQSKPIKLETTLVVRRSCGCT